MATNGVDNTDFKGISGQSRIKKFISPIEKPKNKLEKEKNKLADLADNTVSPASPLGITEADLCWSALMSQESVYERPGHLRLGTIVKLGGNYLLCLQPVCDSVRLEDQDVFPFLPLDIAGREQPFNFSIGDVQERVHLHLPERRLNRICTFTFKVDPGKKTVQAQASESGTHFYEGEKGQFEFVAQLRYEHALRIVSEISTNCSRVGLSESDWQRRIAK